MKPDLSSRKVLGVFQLVMINVIAVDSIRTLPFSAELGFSLIFFYILAALLFFIPSALVSAELGTGWPNRGGIYVWVREAFGKNMSLIIIWLNWIYNLVWYPTIMALIAGAFTYFFDPALSENKVFMSLAILVLFWVATFINCFGMRVSAWLSTLGAIIGTILPMVLIMILGIIWVAQGRSIQVDFTWEQFFPNMTDKGELAFLTNVLFGLLGLEMAATHAAEMQNPQKDYPKALFISVIIILSTIILSSLAIAIVVPHHDLSLVTGALQAFAIFLKAYHLERLLFLPAAFIIIGGLSGVAAWIIGPTKGLLVASQDGSLPHFISQTNKHGVPVRILILQGIIVSFLCLAFVLMPTVNSSFWLLSTMTAQLALIVYAFLFASVIKLRHQKPEILRTFRIPGGMLGVSLVGGIGILCCLLVIAFGFLPPKQVGIDDITVYEVSLVVGILIMFLIPLIIHKLSSKGDHLK